MISRTVVPFSRRLVFFVCCFYRYCSSLHSPMLYCISVSRGVQIYLNPLEIVLTYSLHFIHLWLSLFNQNGCSSHLFRLTICFHSFPICFHSFPIYFHSFPIYFHSFPIYFHSFPIALYNVILLFHFGCIIIKVFNF